MKCKICGNETKKDREICLGCVSVKRVAKSRDKAPKVFLNKAVEHLDKNPGLLNISWSSFFKKNTKTII